jgi:hypothetical protein
MLTSGVVENAIQRFSEELVPSQKAHHSVRSDSFVAKQLRDFRMRSIVVFFSALASLGVAYFVALQLRQLPNAQFRIALLSTTTTRVFWIAGAAYVLFMVALHSVLLLLTLSRVELAVRAVALALFVNIGVGFICSRAIHYSTAAFGLLAGTVVLAILAVRSAQQVLRELDYYYYAAY